MVRMEERDWMAKWVLKEELDDGVSGWMLKAEVVIAVVSAVEVSCDTEVVGVFVSSEEELSSDIVTDLLIFREEKLENQWGRGVRMEIHIMEKNGEKKDEKIKGGK